MGMRDLPTKNNLIKLRAFIKQSKEGKKLLEKKKMILQKEMDKYIKEKENFKQYGSDLFEEAFKILKDANIDIGLENMADIANGIEEDNSIDIKYISVMGVEIPSVILEKSAQKINYGLYSSTSRVDDAIAKFLEVKEYLVKLAEIENTIVRLNNSIEKVKRRINALEEIVIPRDEKIASKISEVLDEMQMEEFARLKLIKK